MAEAKKTRTVRKKPKTTVRHRPVMADKDLGKWYVLDLVTRRIVSEFDASEDALKMAEACMRVDKHEYAVARAYDYFRPEERMAEPMEKPEDKDA